MPELTPLTTVQIEKCRRFAYLINMPIDERDETLAMLCDMALASACPPPESAEVVEQVARAIDPGLWRFIDRFESEPNHSAIDQRNESYARARAAIATYERLSAARAPDKG